MTIIHTTMSDTRSLRLARAFRREFPVTQEAGRKERVIWPRCLNELSKERVVINENGTRKTVTKLEAAIKQLANKAASGDFQAMRLLAALAGSVEVGAAERRNRPDLSDADEKVMARMLEKFQTPKKGEDDGNSD